MNQASESENPQLLRAVNSTRTLIDTSNTSPTPFAKKMDWLRQQEMSIIVESLP